MAYGPDGLPAKECLAQVQEAVKRFLSTIRRNNPKAHILWAYGMMGTVVESAILAGIEAFCAERGENKVHYIRLDEVQGEDIGARSHPGLGGHKAAADTICRKIEELKRTEKE